MVPRSGGFLVASVIMVLMRPRIVVAWLNVVTLTWITVSLSLSRRALRMSTRTNDRERGASTADRGLAGESPARPAG